MRRCSALPLLLSVLAMATPLAAQRSGPEIGGPVPDFTLPDSHGNDHTMSAYRGKYVVLEWLNYGCPSVRKHYDAGNMQALQARYTAGGVIWLSIVSSAPGRQGHYNGAIDDKPGTRPSTLEGAHNYVAAALDEAMSGREVTVPLTRPYG